MAKQKTYRVIALSVGGLSNKIFESGDVVTEDNFLPGRAAELVAQQFLVELSDEELAAKEEEAKAVAEPAKEEEAKAAAELAAKNKGVKK